MADQEETTQRFILTVGGPAQAPDSKALVRLDQTTGKCWVLQVANVGGGDHSYFWREVSDTDPATHARAGTRAKTGLGFTRARTATP